MRCASPQPYARLGTEAVDRPREGVRCSGLIPSLRGPSTGLVAVIGCWMEQCPLFSLLSPAKCHDFKQRLSLPCNWGRLKITRQPGLGECSQAQWGPAQAMPWVAWSSITVAIKLSDFQAR
jgi:hypothetical protein